MYKMYILVRKDLGHTYKMVQGAHGLAQYMLEHTQGAKHWNNNTIVFLDVDSEEKLDNWIYKIESHGLNYSKFYEPDINNQLTSVACYTDSKIFKSLQVAK